MIRLGLIGCGMIVKHHLIGFEEIIKNDSSLFEITAVCDIQEECARDIARKVPTIQNGRKPTIYSDYEEMLEKESLDAVSVATPHYAHHQPTIDALQSGVHAIVEKPFAITVKAGRKMREASEKSKCILASADPYRRTIESRMINWAINKADLIGVPRFFLHHKLVFNLGVVVGTPWRHSKLNAGGGWVLDGEVHYVDFLNHVFGRIESVYAKTRNFEPTRYLNQKEKLIHRA